MDVWEPRQNGTDWGEKIWTTKNKESEGGVPTHVGKWFLLADSDLGNQ